MKKILKYIYYKVESINPKLAYKIKSILYRKNKENNNINDITINGCLDNCDYVIDSTQVSRSQFVTGIQRVVINIINNTSNKYLSAKLYNNELITNQNFNNKNVKNIEKRIDLKNTNKLILLDSSWEFKNDFLSIINNNRYKNLKIVSVVYDLIPVKYPHYTINAYFQNIFVEWHDMVLERADHILCISKSVADDVIDYYQSKDFNRMKPLA